MSNYSNTNDYILYKVTKILPFLSVNMSLATFCFHIIFSAISYVIYLWILVCLIKYKKNLLELNETFCNTIIVLGFVDIITHILSLVLVASTLYPPISILLKDMDELSYIWTIYYSLNYFFPFCQFFLCTYIAFQRLILIFFPFTGADFLKKTYYPFLGLMVATSIAPTYYLWFVSIVFERIPPIFTNGEFVRILVYKKKDWMKDISNSRNSIIHYSIFIILAFLINIISSGKLLIYHYKQAKKTVSDLKQRRVNLNMLLYSICITFTQFLFVAINCVWYFGSRGSLDPSFYYLCFTLRLYVIHLNCLTQPYYLLWLSKRIRSHILWSVGIRAEISSVINKSTTKGRLTINKR